MVFKREDKLNVPGKDLISWYEGHRTYFYRNGLIPAYQVLRRYEGAQRQTSLHRRSEPETTLYPRTSEKHDTKACSGL